MKKETCAAFVCAFLIIAIVLISFALADKRKGPEMLPAPVDVNTETVPGPDGKQTAEKAEDTKTEEPGDNSEKEAPAKTDEKPQSGDPGKKNPEEPPAKKPEKKPEPPVQPVVIEDEPEITDIPKEEDLPESADTGAYEKMVETVYKTADVTEQNGAVYISYSQPEIPSSMHLTVKADVYDINGATVCRYVSDAGWLGNPSYYDPSAKDVLSKMGTADLKDKKFIMVVKVGDAQLSKAAVVWQLVQDYDGSRSLTKSYVQ